LKLRIQNARGAPTLGITLLLASLSLISPLSIDTFLPSFPTIARDFGLTNWQVQQIITAYLVPFACFALVHGPLSDALGRRRVVLGGLVLYTIGSIGCWFAPTFGTMLACRALQGTAAGIGPTVARAVVRDLFEDSRAQKLMSSMMLVFSIAPAVAPVIGGWVHVSLGWRSVFGMLALMGIVLTVICGLLFPETHPVERRTPLRLGALIRSSWQVASGSAYILLAVSAALTFSALFVYIGSAPTIVLENWHLRETQFHYVFLPICAGFVVASLVSGRVAGVVRRITQVRIGFALLCVAGLAGLLAQYIFPEAPIWLMQVHWFFMACGAQFTYPVLAIEMIDMHPNARGAAASVQSFVALGIGAIFMGVVAPAMHGNLRWLAWLAVAAAALAWLCWRAGHELARRQQAVGESGAT
jgi:MFS transporter, DHA1 family, multidrug resistance protein